ncbi:unnamed protein product [Rotaria sp. Silwood2]|nr:unnamed protein product [Rotaria sp. Silwood2]CAF4582623.1 unnamed protein product [Rotaria sp. Silwood2]
MDRDPMLPHFDLEVSFSFTSDEEDQNEMDLMETQYSTPMAIDHRSSETQALTRSNLLPITLPPSTPLRLPTAAKESSATITPKNEIEVIELVTPKKITPYSS